jgi:hypothetical protein
MKKDSTAKKDQKTALKTQRKVIREMAAKQRLTIGLDLGDRTSCDLRATGMPKGAGGHLNPRNPGKTLPASGG